jgi:hypothetical protein
MHPNLGSFINFAMSNFFKRLAKSVKFRLFEKSPFFSGQKDNKIVQAKKHLSQ